MKSINPFKAYCYVILFNEAVPKVIETKLKGLLSVHCHNSETHANGYYEEHQSNILVFNDFSWLLYMDSDVIQVSDEIHKEFPKLSFSLLQIGDKHGGFNDPIFNNWLTYHS